MILICGLGLTFKNVYVHFNVKSYELVVTLSPMSEKEFYVQFDTSSIKSILYYYYKSLTSEKQLSIVLCLPNMVKIC